MQIGIVGDEIRVVIDAVGIFPCRLPLGPGVPANVIHIDDVRAAIAEVV